MSEKLSRNGTVIATNTEINSSKTMEGNFIHIEDAAPINVEECITTLEPIQDLHGYDKPWPAGGGKNLLPNEITSFEEREISFLTQDDGGIKITGTATNEVYSNAICRNFELPEGNYILSATGLENVDIQICNRAGTAEYFSINNTVSSRVIRITKTIASDMWVRFIIHVNATLNTVVYPMIRLASVTDPTFEPYSNECPISGHTGVELTRTGKNLLPMTVDEIKAANTSGTWAGNAYTLNNVTFIIQTDSDDNVTGILASGTASGNIIFISSATYALNGSYILSGCPQNGDPQTYRVDLRRSSNETVIGYDVGESLLINQITENCYVTIRVQNGTVVNNLVFKPMIRLAADAVPTFEPYQGETHSITFPQTQSPVYGCKVDWIQGVLRVTKAYIDLGTKTYTKSPNVSRFYFQSTALDNMKPVPSTAVAGNIICSHYATHSQNELFEGVTGISVDSSALPWINIYDPQFTNATVTEFKTAMSGVQLVYELATPLEIPLTPEVITLLNGINNIWTDSGTTTLTYQPNNVIGELKGEIQLLQSQINTLINQLNNLS